MAQENGSVSTGSSEQKPSRQLGRLVTTSAVAVLAVLLTITALDIFGESGDEPAPTPAPTTSGLAAGDRAGQAAGSATPSQPDRTSAAATASAAPASAAPAASAASAASAAADMPSHRQFLPGAAGPVAPPPAPEPPGAGGSKAEGGAYRPLPVYVLNQTTRRDLAAVVAEDIQAAGWSIAKVSWWRGVVPSTTVYYPPGYESAAQELSAAFPAIDRIRPAVDPMPDDALTVILCKEYPEV